ncbi:hypothetical protein TCAL_07815 [Tigriopus californicus]|uniref:Potassium channel domain-containing protein n=1 Tax=Tigriopus californicus TaxID=6832 RepID=A0A553NNM5_TIGCA|nr:hypothetical protein TCAL_07815 [Tigriopus californicus]
MMSFRNWFLLLVIYVLYLLLGGYIFRWLENPEDCDRKHALFQRKAQAKEEISQFLGTLSRNQLDSFTQIVEDVDEVLEGYKLPGFFGFSIRYPEDELTLHPSLDNVTNSSMHGLESFDLAEECSTWNLYNAVFFSFTALTTIGYGHLSPSTQAGKAVCILYSLLGIPINGVLIGSLATFFGNRINKLKKRTSKKTQKASGFKGKRYLRVFLEIIFYLIPGLGIFVFIPAGVFCLIEDGWTYLDSFYYAFVTLTTIGFGDYVAGRDQEVVKKLGGWGIVYEIGLIVWIVFGLGYLIMIISNITMSLQKPARKAAKRIKMAEKVMVSRIIHEILVMRSKGSGEKLYDDEPRGVRISDSEPCLVSPKGDDVPDEDQVIRKTQSSYELDQAERDQNDITPETLDIPKIQKNIQNIVDEEMAPVKESVDHSEAHDSYQESLDRVPSLQNLFNETGPFARRRSSTTYKYTNDGLTQTDVPKRKPVLRKGARSISMQHPQLFVTDAPKKRDLSSLSNLDGLEDILRDVTLEEFALATQKVMNDDSKRFKGADQGHVNESEEEDEEHGDKIDDFPTSREQSSSRPRDQHADRRDEEAGTNRRRSNLINPELIRQLSSLFGSGAKRGSATFTIGSKPRTVSESSSRSMDVSGRTMDSYVP